MFLRPCCVPEHFSMNGAPPDRFVPILDAYRRWIITTATRRNLSISRLTLHIDRIKYPGLVLTCPDITLGPSPPMKGWIVRGHVQGTHRPRDTSFRATLFRDTTSRHSGTTHIKRKKIRLLYFR